MEQQLRGWVGLKRSSWGGLEVYIKVMAFSGSSSLSLSAKCRINLLLNDIEQAADNISHSLLSLLSLFQVKDASTQTALPNPVGLGNHSLAWGRPVPSTAPSCPAIAEKLDAVQMEVQKLSQALHTVLERQCHLERQQQHQQRLQQEVLMTLQQLSSTISHSAVPATQPCGPFSGMAEPSPTMPNFSQFKMELI